MISTPVSNLLTHYDILRGLHKVNYPYEVTLTLGERPENEVTKRHRPRASSILSDAREIAYYMAGTPHTDPYLHRDERVDLKFTQEQGRLAEELTVAGIYGDGRYDVHSRQVDLPEDFYVSGHPDGMISSQTDRDITIDGLVWGFEHKHYGAYGYKKIVKNGLYVGSPEIIAQMTLYGYALGWDACLAVITSQDASYIRGEYRGVKGLGDHIHPKMMTFSIDLRPYYEEILPFLQARAQWFIDWFENDGNPANVAIEAKDVRGVFPWGYTEYQTQGIADGPGTLVAPTVPHLRRDWARNG